MKESDSEGVAIHADPESCAGGREGVGEALTGACAGWVLSREIHESLRGADAVESGGRPHREGRHREALSDPARSQTPCTRRTSPHGNREISRPTTAAPTAGVRVGNPEGVRR